ncbi:ABC-type branched-chain amino acid transport system, substrate-binding protein [Thermoflexibacter ruber]|uniref:ABC-type branched-chain amino acid transport system, substrate-binding protein n=1 Tax=Thermoflexibacter ruber TaxID=1003 RepID=A0A1I2DQ08_9BACT|nr:ABC-type branched-chain amino acid transport system, substrate-binding protein [Thermoflexibacter ruber]
MNTFLHHKPFQIRFFLIYTTLFAVFILAVFSVFAQSDQELKNSYQYGKQLIAERKFSLAKDIFYKLTQPLPNNIYEKYAHYFYGLALYKTGDKKTARTYLQKLVDSSPAFAQIDEAKYLLGAILLEAGEVKQGLDLLNSIKQSTIKEDINAQKRYFLSTLTTEQLKKLYETTQDESVGRVLAQKLVNERISTDDKLLLETLLVKYNLKSTSLIQTNKTLEPPILKSEYKIALFFPFLLKETSPYSPNRRYQFVYDMYEGMRIAQEHLEKEGVKIKLFTFDTERNDNVIAQLVQKQAKSEIDLIMGPIYPNNIHSLLPLAETKKINIVNPFANDIGIYQSNPYIFFAESSYQTQGKKTAEFAVQNFIGKKAYVYYGRNLEDSLSAFAHKETLEKANYQVFLRAIDSRTIYQRFTSDINNISKTDSAHIFISSSEEAVALNLISATQTGRKILPIIAPETWLNFEQIPYEKYQQAEVHFFASNYVRTNRDAKNFQKEYIARSNMMPSDFAYLGYEMMYYFGKILSKHGINFQNAIRQVDYDKGKMMIGFDFKDSNDNQCVAITKFKEGVLEIVNLPLISIEKLTDGTTD